MVRTVCNIIHLSTAGVDGATLEQVLQRYGSTHFVTAIDTTLPPQHFLYPLIDADYAKSVIDGKTLFIVTKIGFGVFDFHDLLAGTDPATLPHQSLALFQKWLKTHDAFVEEFVYFVTSKSDVLSLIDMETGALTITPQELLERLKQAHDEDDDETDEESEEEEDQPDDSQAITSTS